MNAIVVVGAGGAGLSAAIEAAHAGSEVLLFTKSVYKENSYRWSTEGGCTWKAHAFNAAINSDDNVDAHIADTMSGGAHRNRSDLVEVLCNGAIDLVAWLENLGVDFGASTGHYDARPFGGSGKPRGVFIEDRLGFYIQKSLWHKVSELCARGSIKIFERTRLTSLDISGADSEIKATFLDMQSMRAIQVLGCPVILADGGGASMYSPSASSRDKTCDGIAVAAAAGLPVVDMQYVQFHPTGLISDIPSYDGSLVEEALRFDGATLHASDGHRFMLDVDPRTEQATRDIVSRGIYAQMLREGSLEHGVILNIAGLQTLITQTYPALTERLHHAGYPLEESQQIQIRPTAHYLMGGVEINSLCQTASPMVFAAGETAGGVHGANRLGGNGLSEALVFGRIAGREAAARSGAQATIVDAAWIPCGVQNSGKLEFPELLLHELGDEMYANAGPIRTHERLDYLADRLEILSARAQNCTPKRGSHQVGSWSSLLDLRSLLAASKMIVTAARLDPTPTGSHWIVASESWPGHREPLLLDASNIPVV